MDRILVHSSNIISVGYDTNSHIMEVEFQSGSVYQYFDISEDLYQSLMTAHSKGQYFHDNIMNQYDFEEL
jgi:hypothetical protein